MEEPSEVVADRLIRDLLLPHRNVSKSEVNINAGGVGITVVVCVALVMFTINVMQARQIERQDDSIAEMKHKYERMQDYLNAIYAQAPQLKPPEKKK